MRFHRSLELGDRYDVRTRVIGWDDKHIFIEQGFVRDDAQVALAVVRARFLKRSGGAVTTAEILELSGVTQTSPALPEWVAHWSEAEGGMAFPSFFYFEPGDEDRHTTVSSLLRGPTSRTKRHFRPAS